MWKYWFIFWYLLLSMTSAIAGTLSRGSSDQYMSASGRWWIPNMYWMYTSIFISSGVVSVQYLSFFSAASCFWVAYLFVCSESVSKNKSGTNKIHGCGSGRKFVGYSWFGSEHVLNCDVFNLICPATINFGFLGLLLTGSFTFSWSLVLGNHHRH